MIQTGLIPAAHEDLISDAAFDYYGTRLATCGLDQKIKIWSHSDQETEGGGWQLLDEFKAHDAPITSLSWAHPEFGNMLASGSFDRSVKVWEQVPSFLLNAGVGEPGEEGAKGSGRWRMGCVLGDAKGSVRSIEFSPAGLGLKLATLSTDSTLRIYESLTLELATQFTLRDTIDISLLRSSLPLPFPQTPTGLGTASSNPLLMTPTHPPASLDIPGMGIVGPGGNLNLTLSGAPVGIGGGAGLGVGAAGGFGTGTGGTGSGLQRPGVGIKEADGGWSLSWCKEAYWGAVVAVSCGTSAAVKILQVCTPSSLPSALLTLDPNTPTSSGSQHSSRPPSISSLDPHPHREKEREKEREREFSTPSVSWAPGCGRSYHLIATGSRDGRVRIWKVRAPAPREEGEGEGEGMDVIPADGGSWGASLVGDFGEHEQSVTRVEWNITGTILSTSGADGRVRLWKASLGGVWRPLGSISAEQVVNSHANSDGAGIGNGDGMEE